MSECQDCHKNYSTIPYLCPEDNLHRCVHCRVQKHLYCGYCSKRDGLGYRKCEIVLYTFIPWILP